MAVLAEIFDQGQPLSEFKIELYFKSLMDYPIEAIEKAATAIIKGRVYPAFPKPAEIIQEIVGNQTNAASLAWIDVLETVKRVGQYQSVQFSDPIIHSVIEVMGGWVKLAGDMTCDEEKWKQKEFEKLYEVLSQNPRGKHPDHLAGHFEIENEANGYDTKPEIVKIGFERLRLVEGMRQ